MAKNSPNASLLKFRSRRGSSTGSESITSGQTTNKQSSSSTTTTNEPKRFLRQSGLNQILNEMFISVCRSYLELPLKSRLLVYVCLVFLGGIIGDFAPGLANWIIPFKTHKTNFFNVYFVKLGWFWTIVLLTPFVLMASRVIENRSQWVNRADLARLVLATVFWYVSTGLFVHIESQTGICTSKTIQNRHACIRAGHRWHGFDISGHTFILLYSALIIIEETKSMVGFENFGYLLDSRAQFSQKVQKKSDNHNDLYTRFLVPIRICFVALTLLTLLWDFMLIQTVFFYHSTLQKLLALAWAVALWFITYKVVYPSNIFNLMRLPIRPPNKLEEKQS